MTTGEWGSAFTPIAYVLGTNGSEGEREEGREGGREGGRREGDRIRCRDDYIDYKALRYAP